ncbi:MAG: YkgJ family cysteine cluster protein [Bdellovibrionales bacterium]|nr:YkgJ family cysteine cluster protein [Bdellovibrionales bacterium]
MEPDLSLQQRSERMAATLRALSAETDRFEREADLHCLPGCGDCCNNPAVESTVGELIPLARELAGRGQDGIWHERATQARGGRCVFYAADATDAARGRCSVYELRPGLCRLFAFAAVRDKEGRARLALCRIHKTNTPEAAARAEAGVRDGSLEAPLFLEWEARLAGVSELPSLLERLPINAALARALERVALEPPSY